MDELTTGCAIASAHAQTIYWSSWQHKTERTFRMEDCLVVAKKKRKATRIFGPCSHE